MDEGEPAAAEGRAGGPWQGGKGSRSLGDGRGQARLGRQVMLGEPRRVGGGDRSRWGDGRAGREVEVVGHWIQAVR